MVCTLSIIIPTYKRHEKLHTTLLSVAKYRPSSSETIIIDQSPNSHQQSLHFLHLFPFITYICSPIANLPRARNLGILKSSGTIILFIDDDVIIHRNCLKNHMTLHAQKKVDAIAGRIKQMNSNYSWPQTTHVTSINPHTGEVSGHFDLDTDQTALYASGGHMSIKRNPLLSVGLFNPRYYGNALYEDVDFFFRFRKQGFTILYSSQTLVYHNSHFTGGCHDKIGVPYLLDRLHNHTLFYFLHIKPIPSLIFLKYLKNLCEFITRKKNKSHSRIRLFYCIIVLCKAYMHALISVIYIPRLPK